MPHDKNGKQIEVGDCVRVKAYENGAYVEKFGTVRRVDAAAVTCNLAVDIVVTQVAAQTISATASEVEFVGRA